MKEDEIITEIEKLREEMIKKSELYGIDNPKIMKISKKIDNLHNLLVKLQYNNKTKKNIKTKYNQKIKQDDVVKEMQSYLAYCC